MSNPRKVPIDMDTRKIIVDALAHFREHLTSTDEAHDLNTVLVELASLSIDLDLIGSALEGRMHEYVTKKAVQN